MSGTICYLCFGSGKRSLRREKRDTCSYPGGGDEAIRSLIAHHWRGACMAVPSRFLQILKTPTEEVFLTGEDAVAITLGKR